MEGYSPERAGSNWRDTVQRELALQIIQLEGYSPERAGSNWRDTVQRELALQIAHLGRGGIQSRGRYALPFILNIDIVLTM